MLDLTRPVETSCGCKVRILCIDKKGDYPIVGLLMEKAGKETLETWDLEGFYIIGNTPSNPNNLVNVPEEHTIWVNIYNNVYDAFAHPTKELAEKSKGSARIACKKLTYKEGDFD